MTPMEYGAALTLGAWIKRVQGFKAGVLPIHAVAYWWGRNRYRKLRSA